MAQDAYVNFWDILHKGTKSPVSRQQQVGQSRVIA